MDDLALGTASFQSCNLPIRFPEEACDLLVRQDLDPLIESAAVTNRDIHFRVGKHVVHARDAIGRLGIWAAEVETKSAQPFKVLGQLACQEGPQRGVVLRFVLGSELG